MGTVHPFAELDALRTERNSAVAEAKLWLRRLGAMQRERDQARHDLHEAEKCLAEWQDAYRDRVRSLLREISDLHDEAFILQTRAVILEAEAMLLRYDVALALGQTYKPEPA